MNIVDHENFEWCYEILQLLLFTGYSLIWNNSDLFLFGLFLIYYFRFLICFYIKKNS